MINLFTRRELLLTRDINEVNRVTERLSFDKIDYIMRNNIIIPPGGSYINPAIRTPDAVPADFVNPYGFLFRLYVHKKDYGKAITAVSQ